MNDATIIPPLPDSPCSRNVLLMDGYQTGEAVLHVVCLRCGHRGERPVDVSTIDRWSLIPRLRCSQCGARGQADIRIGWRGTVNPMLGCARMSTGPEEPTS